MNHQVAIPAGFFLKEAKHEYYDYRTRLVTELLQNSLDAGATVIKLTFDALGYKCDDNGCGMSQDRMVSALLTMGGSAKEQGATGGFGAAKKLLLFSHESFVIHSNDTFVAGNGLSYRFMSMGSRKGTEIGAIYTPDFEGAGVEERARRLLRKCNFKGKCRIYINGELFTDYTTFPSIKEVDGLGEVFGTKRRNDNEYVWVRHNGLFMFSTYVDGLKRSVVIETTGKSTDLFTQNRDGFTGEYARRFAAFISELTVNKESFVKPKSRKFIFKGMESFFSLINQKFVVTPEIQAALNHVRMNTVVTDTASFVEAVMAKVEASPTSTIQDVIKTKEIVSFVLDNEGKMEVDFHFDLADSKFNKAPWWLVPNTGKKKFTQLAALWKVCVREVLKANGIDQSFVIGYTLSSTATATHQMKNGVSCYLLNPKSKEIDSGSKREKVISLLTVACHEVVHSQGCQYHDETFVRKFHDLLVPTLTKAPTWRQLIKLSKTERV